MLTISIYAVWAGVHFDALDGGADEKLSNVLLQETFQQDLASPGDVDLVVADRGSTREFGRRKFAKSYRRSAFPPWRLLIWQL